MRVALNAHFFHHPQTGSGRYLFHLLRAFAAGSDVQPLPACDGVPVSPPDGWPGRIIPRLGRTPFDRGRGRAADLRKVWWEQVTWPWLAAQHGARIAHVPYFAPPIASRVPVVATIHDVITLTLPEYAASPLIRWYNRVVALGARRAARVLVDSEASKRDVIRYLRVPPQRVEVIYLAPDESVLRPVPPKAVEAVRQRYGVDGPFIFYLGGLDRRKNVPQLFRAVAALDPQVRCPILVSGKLRHDNPTLFPDLPRLAEELGIAGLVRFVFVPDEDLPAVYRAATCFAFPSIYEGAGLDPLEALACGTPVVCSSRSSLPEYVGDAAVLVDPDDPVAFANALKRVLTDADLRADLAERGPVQAARFSWGRTAATTAAAYRLIAP